MPIGLPEPAAVFRAVLFAACFDFSAFFNGLRAAFLAAWRFTDFFAGTFFLAAGLAFGSRFSFSFVAAFRVFAAFLLFEAFFALAADAVLLFIPFFFVAMVIILPLRRTREPPRGHSVRSGSSLPSNRSALF